jgi:hypothetical protein
MADEKENSPSATGQMPRVRRRAPTIDLKATEVAVEPQESAVSPSEPESEVPPEYSTEPPPSYEVGGGAPPQEPPPPPRSLAWASFLGRPGIEAGIVGALAALLVFVVLWLAGMFSSPENTSDQRLAAMEARLQELASRPPAVETRAIDELAGRLGRLESAARSSANGSGNGNDAALGETIKSLEVAAADLARRADDNATAIREARGRADAALLAADAAKQAVERNNIEALGNRIAALERASKALTDDVAKTLAASGDRPLRAAVAAQALRASVERGDTFAAELTAAKAVAPDAKGLAPLEPFAASGLPTAAMLARQLSELAPAMLKVNAAPDGGFLDRLQANAEKLVRVRPIDEAPGGDPAAVISRAQGKASRGDLAGAVAELNTLPANVRAPAEDWIKQVEARDVALNASRRLVTDALAALGKPSP